MSNMGRIEPGRYDRVLCVVLAGGQGSRLGPLTEGRSKPSLRVGGHYRLIDVALSNIATAPCGTCSWSSSSNRTC
ncbi:MAG: sugar phosphate nucleotidyltransferase [Acidimicrobiales bacterium]